LMALRQAGRVLRRFSTKEGTLAPGSVGKEEFLTTNWTKERQEKVTESLLQTKEKLEEKWRQTEMLSGAADENTPVEDVRVNKVTGEVGGPKGLEPTRFGDWERKGRVTDF
jgi:hypothetical protein